VNQKKRNRLVNASFTPAAEYFDTGLSGQPGFTRWGKGMTPRGVSTTVCVLGALSAGVVVNVTFLQRGTVSNWAVRAAFPPVVRVANAEAQRKTSTGPIGVGGHDGRSDGRANTARSPQPASTAGNLGRTKESAAFASSNEGDVLRAVQRELGRRGYNPGIANGVANVTTRVAIMAYQRDHGLPLTGEASDALLKAIVFANAGTVGATGNSIGAAQGKHEAPIIPAFGAGRHATPSPRADSSGGDVGRIGEGASNGVHVMHVVQREPSQRGYKPGTAIIVANVATRGSYQRLPLAGKASDVLPKAIPLENSGAVRAADSIGTAQGHTEVPILRVASKPLSTSRASQRTVRVAMAGCAGDGRRASRSTCEMNSQARAKTPHRAGVPGARVALNAAPLGTGRAARPRIPGWEILTSSISAPRATTPSKARRPISEQKDFNLAGGPSKFESLIWTQLAQIR
jgi:peptidoglycan hydrolase-like protein with peptidoglycan-binding domain